MESLIQLTRAVTGLARPEDKAFLQHVHSCKRAECEEVPECEMGKKMLIHFKKCLHDRPDGTCSWCLVPRAILALDQKKLTETEYNHVIVIQKTLHEARVAWQKCPETDLDEKKRLLQVYRDAEQARIQVALRVFEAVKGTY